MVQITPNPRCPRLMMKKKMVRITKHGAQMSLGLGLGLGLGHPRQQAQLVQMKVVMSQASMSLQKTN